MGLSIGQGVEEAMTGKILSKQHQAVFLSPRIKTDVNAFQSEFTEIESACRCVITRRYVLCFQYEAKCFKSSAQGRQPGRGCMCEWGKVCCTGKD